MRARGQSLEINERLRDQSGVAITLIDLGILALEEGKKQEAEENIIKANQIFKSINLENFIKFTDQLLKRIKSEV